VTCWGRSARRRAFDLALAAGEFAVGVIYRGQVVLPRGAGTGPWKVVATNAEISAGNGQSCAGSAGHHPERRDGGAACPHGGVVR